MPNFSLAGFRLISDLPLRTESEGQETLVERAECGQPVAFFPISLEYITSDPNGRTWAGSSANHVYIITLEGDPSAPPAEPTEQR